MEDRTTHSDINIHENMKSHSFLSPKTHSLLSPKSDISSHNSSASGGSSVSCSCIDHHHNHNFKSSTSECTHTYSSTNNTNTSHFSSALSNITLKSNSPAIFIPNNRRNSLSLNNGDIIDDHLTILHLTNSETIDTKDVYVMANETNQIKANINIINANNTNNNTMNNNNEQKQQQQQHQSLAVPKWNVSDIEESADEYDSEAHTITDEDIIIKRVLAKFNQQNQQIVRKKLSFVDSFQFFQSNIDAQKHSNSISYRYKHKHNKNHKSKHKHSKSKKKSKKSSKKKKKKKKKRKKKHHHKTNTQQSLSTLEHSESKSIPIYLKRDRKLSEGHQEILADISRRATINEPPPSLADYSKQPIIHNSTQCKRKKQNQNQKHRSYASHSHVRTITPFDPISLDLFDTDSENDDNEIIIEQPHKSKHKKTLTAINIQMYTGYDTAKIHRMGSHNSESNNSNTPEPMMPSYNNNNNNNNKNTNNHNHYINHRKTMSHGPRLMSTVTQSANNTRRNASIVPNMEEMDDDFLSSIFMDDIGSDDMNIPEPAKPMKPMQPILINSASSPPLIPLANPASDNKCETDNETIKPKEWNELETLNEMSEESNIEYMDDDMDDMDSIIKYDDMKDLEFGTNQKHTITTPTPQIKSNVNKTKHRRLISAPVVVGNDSNKKEQRDDMHIYQTWNYFEEMSDSLKSDFNSDDTTDKSDDDMCDTDNDDIDSKNENDNMDADDIENENDHSNENENNDANVTFGTERVFSTFTKELAITSENPKYLFESLSQICVSLRSKKNSTLEIKHTIPFDSPILRHERVISFLKLLGFERNYALNAYIITVIDTANIDAALSACQQQLIEISKKSATYQVIITSRLRNGSVTTNIPPPPPIVENKSDKPDDLELEQLSDIDADRCQLYELIWSATHPSNTDHKAKDVILLCYILITTPLKFMKLLEARFFNDDHGRASRSYSTSDSNILCSANGSPTVGSVSVLLGTYTSSMAQSPTFPSSIPSLTTSSITFDYERIQSSYGVQKKVIQMIRLWMQKYWKEDWNNNYKLLSYIDIFVRKAKKAYRNDDIGFDDNERDKGLELIATVHKCIQKQKASLNDHTSEFSDCKNNNNKLKAVIVRPRSISSNSGVVNKRANRQQRRTSLHKRKFSSILSSPKMSKRHSFESCDEIPNDLLKISNEAICNQLALYIFNTYCAINARECLYQYSPKHKHKENICPNIQIYKDTFNDVVKWVQSTILLQSQVSKRARMIKKWIKITDLLFNIRCFQGFVAVQCALASNAIYTLKDAWNQNSVLKRKHHTKFKEIKVIMSASHNFENLRRLQREAHAPLIPYFGIFCKDLIYIQEGVSKRNSDGMINWSKLWRISELIKDHLTYQNTSYQRIIQKDTAMQDWLQTELKRSGALKTEHIDKIAKDVAQKDKNKKIGHKKSFTLMQ